MRDIAITAFILGAIPWMIARPYVGLLMFAWVSFMSPHRLTWGFAYSLPFAQIIAIATLIGMVFSKDRQTFPVNRVTVVWLLFVAYMGVSTFFAMYPSEAIPQLEKVYKIQLLALLTLVLINTREKLRLLLWVIVFSVGFYGVKGGLYTATGGGGLVWGPSGSFIAENNALALATLMTIPLMRALQLHEKNKYVRWALGAAMVLSAFSVAGSYSRGAFVGATAMLIFFWLKSRQKIFTGIGVVVVASVVLMSMPQTWWDRMGTIQTYQEDSSAQGRIDAWYTAVGVANHRFFGAGFEGWSQENFDRFSRPGAPARDVHSIYFEVLGEHGWGALVLFLALGWLTWGTGAWIVRNTRDRQELRWYHDVAVMTQVGLVAYAAGGAFLGLAYYDLPYALIGTLVLLRVFVERELTAEASRLSPVKGPLAKFGAARPTRPRPASAVKL